MSVEIGQQISHYKILEKLGEGGMGVVYKAQDTSLNRLVALKFLPPQLTQVEENRNRFIVEAQAASALDHVNICNIHEINEGPDGQRFICMAYYQGDSLRQKIKQGPIPLDEAVNILIQIARGLEAAHSENIIHRDVKPGNIIITNKGEIKIVDFGLAKLAGSEMTRTTTSRGTAAYMCPEQIRGQKFDHRCDIWALGVVFYEMLTGHLPFEGDYPEPIMYAIVNENPTPLSHYLEDVPDDLQHIIDKLLEKNLSRRYQSSTEALEDLLILTNNDNSTILKSKPAILKLLSRKRAYLYGSVTILLVILVLFFSRSYLFSDQHVAKFVFIKPFENVMSNNEQEDIRDGITRLLTNELDQISGLKVIHHSTAMTYKGTSKTPSEISEEMGVDYIIESLFVKADNHVTISAKIFYAPDNDVIGGSDSEGEYRNIFKIINEVAGSIGGQIDPNFKSQDQKRSDQDRPIDPRAFELYLQGYSHLNKWTKVENNKAIEYFWKSVKIDSNFALPYSGLMHGYGQLIYWGDIPWDEGVTKVKEIIEKALQIDDQRAETYQALGALHLWQLWDWEEARVAFQRARNLNPNLSGFSGSEYSWYLITMGQVDAAIKEAERLLPLDPLSYATRNTVNAVYYFSRQFDKAIDFCQRSIELDPEDWRAYSDLADNYEITGKYDESHHHRLSALKLSGYSQDLVTLYDSLYTVLGPKAYPTWLVIKSEHQTEKLDKNPVATAWIYERLGEKEMALDWLERGYEKKTGDLVTLNIDPKWDALREEPRFQDILARMNFPN